MVVQLCNFDTKVAAFGGWGDRGVVFFRMNSIRCVKRYMTARKCGVKEIWTVNVWVKTVKSLAKISM